MTRVAVTAAVVLTLAGTPSRGGQVARPIQDSLRQGVVGHLRLWGTGEVSGVIERWTTALQARYPALSFETCLLGSDTAMAGLYSGVADVAFMGRDATPKEIMAFEWVFQYRPTSVEILTGSLSSRAKSSALAVMVHAANPVARISLTQLDALFGYERRRGAAERLTTWGQLQVEGALAGRAVHLYGVDTDTGTGRFFRRVVVQDSRKLNWDVFTEFDRSRQHDGLSAADASDRVVNAVANDPLGLGVARLDHSSPSVKVLPVSLTDEGPWVPLTEAHLVDRTYPLTRGVLAWINRRPDRPVSEPLRAFFDYVLSDKGQQSVLEGREYLPLSRPMVDAERRRLGL